MAALRFSTRSEYGLRALLDLAIHGNGAPVTASEIAERQEMPLHYLEQLLSSLKKAGIVRSTRGPRGGFELARPPSEVDLHKVIGCLEGGVVPADCLDEVAPAVCNLISVCAVRNVWKRVAQAIAETLRGITLEDVRQEQLELQGQFSPMYHI